MKEPFKRRGRPRVGTGKDGQVCVRTSPRERAMLDYLVEKTGKSKTNMIIDAIRAQYNFEMSKDD